MAEKGENLRIPKMQASGRAVVHCRVSNDWVPGPRKHREPVNYQPRKPEACEVRDSAMYGLPMHQNYFSPANKKFPEHFTPTINIL